MNLSDASLLKIKPAAMYKLISFELAWISGWLYRLALVASEKRQRIAEGLLAEALAAPAPDHSSQHRLLSAMGPALTTVAASSPAPPLRQRRKQKSKLNHGSDVTETVHSPTSAVGVYATGPSQEISQPPVPPSKAALREACIAANLFALHPVRSAVL